VLPDPSSCHDGELVEPRIAPLTVVEVVEFETPPFDAVVVDVALDCVTWPADPLSWLLKKPLSAAMFAEPGARTAVLATWGALHSWYGDAIVPFFKAL
jgi:hypothetical protein